jgi:hypothetical protein
MMATITFTLRSQTITTLAPTQTSACAGGNIIVQYETTGTFDLICTFTAQLSDEWGNFSNPVPIGSVPINTGVIFGTIPSNTSFGLNYRIRVVSSSPYVVGSVSPFPPIAILSSAVSAYVIVDPSSGEACQGDTITLSTLLNESYFWSTGETTQSIKVTQSGTYAVTVTNYITGCEVSAPPVDITIHPLPAIDLGPDQSKCNGDTVLLDAGSGYANYLWSNSGSNSSINVHQSGTYWVRVRDQHNCVNRDTTVITFYPVPQISLGNDTILCADEFTLSVPSGFAQYNWNNGLSFNPTLDIFQTGTYHVIVTSQHNCTGYDTINVQMFPVPYIELGNNIFACQPPIILNAGDNYTSYNWNNGDGTSQYYYVQLTGVQHVTVTDDNGCAASDSVYVGIFGIPQVDLGQLITADYNDTLELDAGPGMLHYQWSTGDTTQIVTIYAENLNAGIYFYSVTVTGDYGCTNSDQVVVHILEPYSVETTAADLIAVYPNPFTDGLYISSPEKYQWTISDISGKPVAGGLTKPGLTYISADTLPAGFYILSLHDNNKLVTTRKLSRSH